MAERFWDDGARQLLADLRSAIAARAPAEAQIPAALAAAVEAAQNDYDAACRQSAAAYEAERAATEGQYESARAGVVARHRADHESVQRRHDEACCQAASRYAQAEKAEREKLEEIRWEATTVFEATKKGLDAQYQQTQQHLEAQGQEIVAIRQAAMDTLSRRRLWQEQEESPAADALPADDSRAEANPLERLTALLAQARQQLHDLVNRPIPRLFEGGGLLGVLILGWLACLLPAVLLLGWLGWYGLAAGLAAAIAGSVGLHAALSRIALRQSIVGWLALRETLALAQAAHRDAMETARRSWAQRLAQANAAMENQCRRAEETLSARLDESARCRQEELAAAEQEYVPAMEQMAVDRDRQLADAEQQYVPRLQAMDRRYQEECAARQAEHERKMAGLRGRYQADWDAMASQWRSGVDRFRAAVDDIRRTCRRRFFAWDAPDGQPWAPAVDFPPAVPFGRLAIDLAQFDGGMPRDEQLKPERAEFSLPALFPFAQRSVLLLKAQGDGRGQAVQALQAVMLRMLTSIPPGKLRFLIFDPVGLGENFSAFMHLADYNEQLVASRIWTETSHIEERLAELTEHMENVIQVYLRNEFPSIQEYNQFAGEVAQAYRVLVVANFPAGFSEAAARRLVSIAASGARCGVYALVSVDTRMRLPRDFQLANLERHAINLRWQEGRFLWDDADFAALPLELDRPPAAERFTEIVRRVGSESRDLDRVEVPFSCVEPPDDAWWTADTRGGIDVPLGRAGATKLQHLRLGKGTLQHVLIAGKTGSGKSTLLHVLITNLAMRYSPDEVELYLVDFKKGVEFKGYAQARLPHARVIAIESEREFGLSVLERLDLELKRRGDLFRARGVQDLPGFRAVEPSARLPRVLLVIDEFQELFVEDDRIAQNAALLLDRLVRQGRAFGIHVLLGSQTLAGAYSLPRSTMGQMAVRIALQCSEADAHLILSEENTAARLLVRPGEAIYNDANGLYEGNHPFQVVWLADDERDRRLGRIRQLAAARHVSVPPAIVFEGNMPAEPAANPLLGDLLAAPSWPETPRAPQAWLGEAVAIKEPTAAVFARQSGRNLLLVGYQEEEALGVLATCLVSLAAQHAPGGPAGGCPRFCVLDGARPDSPLSGQWQRVAAALPHGVRVEGPRGAAAMIGQLAQEVARREQAADEHARSIYLFVYDLARFRDLRKADEDFGFSRRGADEPASPARQFMTLLHDGPAVGVHTLLWCDTYNNVLRWLDRQGLREMELRVLFQVNATDSSNLIDSPAASQLGIHRAVLCQEAEGRLEKFRPYGLPSDDWLGWIRAQWHARPAVS